MQIVIPSKRSGRNANPAPARRGGVSPDMRKLCKRITKTLREPKITTPVAPKQVAAKIIIKFKTRSRLAFIDKDALMG